MQSQGSPDRAATFTKAQDTFKRALTLGNHRVERVTIPYQGSQYPALYCRAPGDDPSPSWFIATASIVRKSCFTGQSSRMPWHNAGFQHSVSISPARIGMSGISLGGHFAPRAVAFEPRFASGADWGANHNWAEVQQRRQRHEGEKPVPHYWAHVMWVFGATDMDDFDAKTKDMTFNGVMDRIKVPFLVTHCEKDRQIGLEYAQQSFDQLINCPQRELKIFTAREGRVEHVGADNMDFGQDYIADWFAQTFGGRTAACSAG